MTSRDGLYAFFTPVKYCSLTTRETGRLSIHNVQQDQYSVVKTYAISTRTRHNTKKTIIIIFAIVLLLYTEARYIA